MPTLRVTEAPLRVAVLAGGESAERAVSLCSGAEVARALSAGGHRAETFDPAVTPLEQIPWRRFDACFLALHGGAGEDGRVQRWLEDHTIAYTGSGPAASQAAMSKSAAKLLFRRAGVPTPKSVLLTPDDDTSRLADTVASLGLPVIVKPDGQGSSLGLALVRQPADLPAQIAQSRRFDRCVLIERFIAGREMTVSVLGRRALPTLEVVGRSDVFDYDSKYNSQLIEFRFPGDLGPMKTEEIRSAAVAAAAAVGTAGLVRVDLIVDARQQPWVLEVNTVPGMTDHSLAPKAAAAVGLDLPGLCDWMLRDALARQPAARRP